MTISFKFFSSENFYTITTQQMPTLGTFVEASGYSHSSHDYNPMFNTDVNWVTINPKTGFLLYSESTKYPSNVMYDIDGDVTGDWQPFDDSATVSVSVSSADLFPVCWAMVAEGISQTNATALLRAIGLDEWNTGNVIKYLPSLCTVFLGQEGEKPLRGMHRTAIRGDVQIEALKELVTAVPELNMIALQFGLLPQGVVEWNTRAEQETA